MELWILLAALAVIGLWLVVLCALHRQALRFVFDPVKRERILDSWRRRRRER